MSDAPQTTISPELAKYITEQLEEHHQAQRLDPDVIAHNIKRWNLGLSPDDFHGVQIYGIIRAVLEDMERKAARGGVDTEPDEPGGVDAEIDDFGGRAG